MVYWDKFNFVSLDAKPTLKKYKNYSKEYDNNIYTLDIETTSVFKFRGINYAYDEIKHIKNDIERNDKIGIMYIWQFGINDEVVYGRRFSELREFLERLNNHISSYKIVYVHNLSYEFHFLLNAINFNTVFARKEHKPIKTTCGEYGIEFRCSYILFNTSLDKLPSTLKLPVKKLVGDLDYRKVRHSKTVLTDAELKYAENDCLVLYHALSKVRDEYNGRLIDIPLTQTGRLRRYIREKFITDQKYMGKIADLVPRDFKEFSLLTKVFAGGYTHACDLNKGIIVSNVGCADLRSSYPAVMVSEKYPMERFREFKRSRIEDLPWGDKYCFIVDITFHDIRNKCYNVYLSAHKAVKKYDIKMGEDNGRMYRAERCRYILTDIDLEITLRTYKIKGYEINACYYARKDYLDKRIIESVLDLYGKKTQLKNVDEEYDNYRISKEYINALYGMCVTNTIRDNVVFDKHGWDTKELTEEQVESKLKEQKDGHKLFFSYAWGVWIPAYARRNLWTAIKKIDSDMVYSDTDSVYYLNKSLYTEYFEKYNKLISNKIENVCAHYNLDKQLAHPVDPKGRTQSLGTWEEGDDKAKFCTLGAKKYAYEKICYNKKIKLKRTRTMGKSRMSPYDLIEITVSGVHKAGGAKQLKSLKQFKDGLIFSEENARRLILTYNSEQQVGEIVDYTGVAEVVDQKYGINLMPSTYTLSYKLTNQEINDVKSTASSVLLTIIK